MKSLGPVGERIGPYNDLISCMATFARMKMTPINPIPRTNVAAIVATNSGFISFSSLKQKTRGEDTPRVRQNFSCFGNPAIPGAWDPWLSVLRLLGVWLYRQLESD